MINFIVPEIYCFEHNPILNKKRFAMSRRQNPNDFLKQIIGRPVVVKLNSGVDYRQGRICNKYMQKKTRLFS